MTGHCVHHHHTDGYKAYEDDESYEAYEVHKSYEFIFEKRDNGFARGRADTHGSVDNTTDVYELVSENGAAFDVARGRADTHGGATTPPTSTSSSS